MKPIKHPQTSRLRGLKTFREDLDELLGLFQAKCAHVTISDKRKSYDDFDDMKKHVGSRISYLDIRGEQPGLQLTVNYPDRGGYPNYTAPAGTFNELRADEATEESDLLFFRIKDFLNTHQQPRVRWQLVVLAIVAFGSMLLFVSRHQEAAGVRNHAAPWLIVVVFVWESISIASLLLAFMIRNYLTLEPGLTPLHFGLDTKTRLQPTRSRRQSVRLPGAAGWFLGHFLK